MGTAGRGRRGAKKKKPKPKPKPNPVAAPKPAESTALVVRTAAPPAMGHSAGNVAFQIDSASYALSKADTFRDQKHDQMEMVERLQWMLTCYSKALRAAAGEAALNKALAQAEATLSAVKFAKSAVPSVSNVAREPVFAGGQLSSDALATFGVTDFEQPPATSEPEAPEKKKRKGAPDTFAKTTGWLVFNEHMREQFADADSLEHLSKKHKWTNGKMTPGKNKAEGEVYGMDVIASEWHLQTEEQKARFELKAAERNDQIAKDLVVYNGLDAEAQAAMIKERQASRKRKAD